MTKQITIGIVIYEACTSSMVTGLWDILTLANHLHGLSSPLFKLELIGETKAPIHSFSGLTFTPTKTIQTKTLYDIVYVPGFLGNADEILVKEQKIIDWLGKIARLQQTVLTAACNGNFLLAQCGALDHKKATTHWSLVKKLEDDYNNIKVEPEKIIVDNGTVISAAGVTSYFNLGLHLIQRYANADLSLHCAKVFLVDSGRKIQTPYQVYQFSKRHGDEPISQVQQWLEENFNKKTSLDSLARLSSLGKKTFIRRFKKATGETPQVYVQKLRIETAKRLLESQNLTFNEVTWEVGYNDVSSFHKAFKVETGLTPIEYRNKFSFI
jgi:transcriptional regulator GlxA family with amidase domain